MTGPNQGLSSLAPGGGKIRDSGNEVDFFLDFFFLPFWSAFPTLGGQGKIVYCIVKGVSYLPEN